MKKTNITLSIALAAVFSASTAFAEAEVTGKIVHESAKFTTSGTTIGAATAHDKDVMKTETSARIYIDGDAEELQEGATYHVELNLMRDSKGIGKYDGNESYTQRDALREAYVDATVDDWSIRAGKQQVVWGTADGMKLLDMINPTDYSEMAQNQMEDSRIPVFMVNAEKTNEDGSEFQVVVSQPRENVFAGLDRNVSTTARSNGTPQLADNWDGTWGAYTFGATPTGDGAVATIGATSTVDATSSGHSQGQAFIMKGVDSITGKTNGFVNIAPDLGSVATRFYNQFCESGCNSLQDAQYITVNDFANLTGGTTGEVSSYFSGYTVMAAFADNDYDGAAILNGFAGVYDTNLTDATSAATFAPSGEIDSTFEYMRNATFATFDTFAGAKSQYVYNMPESTDLDIATRYKNTTPEGMNYSVNYSYNYDKNPIINLSWRDSSTGAELYKKRAAGTSNPLFDHTGTARDTTSIELYASAADATAGTNRYGAYGASGDTAGTPTLRFEQTVKRAHNIGGSFDTAIETEGLGPVVLRGEALYQKDVYSPVMDLTALSIGDLTDSLKMEKGDRFKYVLGADITALTNMMVSVQFIQDRNLDYVDTSSTISGNSDISSLGKYTADYSTMSMSNSFNKAEKDKNFYSLFFSKPFGASGEHRWNNIFMFEENGGKWNRLDAEFSIDDDTQATVEYNKYWGDANTQFGQLEKSSNIQVGVKYSF
jgi:hypothetical protein